MIKLEKSNKVAQTENDIAGEQSSTLVNKPKNRGKKRKRQDSDSSTDIEDLLPENALEVEKNLHASAIKNNLDDVSVKKILKKVVTNDHVLALVKLREEEEESSSKERKVQPKLTRAKAKELMRVSPKTAPWNLELTPIKHIPVKTHPEVKALIAQELPEDEDDDEYQPTHDDVPSDDDQTLESCSDVDSQPATPVTSSNIQSSPAVLKDGPFKVPHGITTPARRKLIVDEEEATIALRTRSKLSLSATPIEHIESSFVPPDEVPTPVVDEIWNQFLEECLNPAELSRNEDDDEADPEYNVAADPDAHDEDEEALESSIIKISKKELNDLVTELFSILPEAAGADELAENLAKDVLTETSTNEISSHWEGKQEPNSDEETLNQPKVEAIPEKISQQKRNSAIRLSIGKSEPEDTDYNVAQAINERRKSIEHKIETPNANNTTVNILVEEQNLSVQPATQESVPPPLLRKLQSTKTKQVRVSIDNTATVLPEQIIILQQQLRQHVQLAASNFLQLYVHPVHWNLAPPYKEYLEQFNKMLENNPKSVVNVCNLKPALDLVTSWETTVAEDTPENKKMVEFIQSESERSRRRYNQNSLYVGEFPETFQKVVANSTVFLYPYLLPAMPYRAYSNKKFGYRRSEDELIVLGMDQFWQYIEDNPQLFKKRKGAERWRWGLVATCALVCKHMMPWLAPKGLQAHIHRAKKEKDNPIAKFFENREVTAVQHKLLPFNPSLTLYEQPEHEMPRIWVRYLAKNSRRFKNQFYRRKESGRPPEGVPIETFTTEPKKNPLPIDFTKTIHCNRVYNEPQDKFDVIVNNNTVANTLNLVTSNETVTIKDGAGNVMPAVTLLTVQNTSNNETVVENITTNTTGDKTESINKRIKNSTMLSLSAGFLTIKPITTIKLKVKKDNVDFNEVVTDETANSQEKRNSHIPVADIVPVISNIGAKQTEGTIKPTVTHNNYALHANMYKVVQTSLGAYLVPLKVLQTTNTVNSVTSPITSATQDTVIGNNLSKGSRNSLLNEVLKKVEDLKNHCQCCLLLKKICKERQTVITDFFKPKRSEEKKCECTHKNYPKISKMLKMLVNNYKSRSCSEVQKLEATIEMLKKERMRDKRGQRKKTEKEEEDSMDDIAFVTTFQLKMTIRSALIKNIHVKKTINKLFSNFDVETDDPVKLADQISNLFNVDLVDLYKEFIGFLTPDQADRIEKFKDYFIQRCIGKLVKKVEAEVQDKAQRQSILSHLSKIFSDNFSTSCDICSGILTTMTDHPQLARYVFSLFPHRAGKRNDRLKQNSIKIIQSNQQEPTANCTEHSEKENDKIDEEIHQTRAEEPGDEVMDYEADHSESDEGNEENLPEFISTRTQSSSIKMELASNIEIDTPELTISKTEVQELSESTTMSPLVMSEDEIVKAEVPEWKREEDKLILKVLLQFLTPQERKEKTILEILEEKNVYQMIADSIPHKSIDDVKERVMYLLEILVLSDY